MSTFTSTLPDDLLHQLDTKSRELKLPKNRLIEQALRIYLDQLNKAAYIQSYKKLAKDTDILLMAEEGMAAYIAEVQQTEKDD